MGGQQSDLEQNARYAAQQSAFQAFASLPIGEDIAQTLDQGDPPRNPRGPCRERAEDRGALDF